ncbi:MAG TPA: hypothetical protein VEQ65_01405, partial [Opitutus sp.]|nr:hypothetical protein [Opitutus sp.]
MFRSSYLRTFAFVAGVLAAAPGLFAAAPADENYDGYAVDGAGVGSPRTLGGFVYEAQNSGETWIFPADNLGLTVGSGNVLVTNSATDSAVTWVEFHSSALSDNFALVSLTIESLTAGVARTFTVTGYDGGSGTTAVVSDTIDFAVSDASGSITYAKNGGANGGTLTFSSAWQNIDTVRFTATANSVPYFALDSIDISAAVIPAAITSATYDASTGVLSVTGTDVTNGGTIDVSKLTLTGQGGATYTLTSGNVTASSATSFSVTLNAA